MDTATAGGTPIMMSSGFMMNPPPTPNRPESAPTSPPIRIGRIHGAAVLCCTC